MHTISTSPRSLLRGALAAAIATLAGCGGGGGIWVGVGGSQPPPVTPPPPPPIANPLYLVSAPSPFAAGCSGSASNGALYVNAEVEPYVAVDPTNANHLVGVWQQDRWSAGGARGLLSAASFDGGKSWTRTPLPVTACGGGTAANAYSFASDPWVSIGPSGIVHAISLSFDANDTAILATRSLDGGRTWASPSTLILDGPNYANDKESITADPGNPNLVYAVWDRGPTNSNAAPATFARSTNAGASWESARTIYDPGSSAQTLGNEIVVLPNGNLLDLFTQIDYPASGPQTAAAMVIGSTDKGLTWSAPIKVADMLPIGATDPETGKPVRDGSDLAQIAVAANGSVYVTWADARFSNGQYDSIALSRSSDGGATWSAPVAINPADHAEAFEPSIHVRADGTITVSYYDFRNDTADPNTLPTILWLTRSTDAVNWQESAVAGPFDLDYAPYARGLFLGDYQGLTSMGSISEPFFVMTNNSTSNRTDVFSAPQAIVTTMLNLMTRAPMVHSAAAPLLPISSTLQAKVAANLARLRQRREAVPRSGDASPPPVFHP